MPRINADAITTRQSLDDAMAALIEEGWKPPCAGEPEAWFSLTAATIVEAVTACQSCQVLAQCAAYAVADPQTAANGVWAALPDDDQREVLARQRRCA